jgi:hypothetical protein
VASNPGLGGKELSSNALSYGMTMYAVPWILKNITFELKQTGKVSPRYEHFSIKHFTCNTNTFSERISLISLRLRSSFLDIKGRTWAEGD